MGQRRRYSPEFKARVVKDAMREADTLTGVAARHGVHPSQVREWRKQAESALVDGFRKGQPKADGELEAKLEQALRKVGELTVEKDFFLRALGQ